MQTITVFLGIVVLLFVVLVITGYRAVFPGRRRITVTPLSLGLPHEDIRLQTSDGKQLIGWLVHSPSAAGVIICLHGYPSNRSEILPVISFLYPECSLLFFDFRAHGDSGGRRVTFGLNERHDLRAAVDFVRERYGKDVPTGLWGHSMGGVVALLFAAENPTVRAVVTDSAYADFSEMSLRYFWFLGPLQGIVGRLARWTGGKLLFGDYSRVNPAQTVGNLRCPVLFIHGEKDRFVPREHADRLHSLACEPKEFASRPGPHYLFGVKYPPELQSQVREFYRSCFP